MESFFFFIAAPLKNKNNGPDTSGGEAVGVTLFFFLFACGRNGFHTGKVASHTHTRALVHRLPAMGVCWVGSGWLFTN